MSGPKYYEGVERGRRGNCAVVKPGASDLISNPDVPDDTFSSQLGFPMGDAGTLLRKDWCPSLMTSPFIASRTVSVQNCEETQVRITIGPTPTNDAGHGKGTDEIDETVDQPGLDDFSGVKRGFSPPDRSPGMDSYERYATS